MNSPEIMQEDFSVHYTYTRSTGPVIGDFLTALRDDKQILGIKGSDGRTLVPPMEFDPITTEPLSEMVKVSDQGTVTSFCWVKNPISHHHIQHAFAFATIRLDGADTDFIHMVDCVDEAKISIGSKVKARWAEERSGTMTDIVAFDVTGA
ncbi:MAG: OB-fold domain-containing protein [Pseudomonadales bacterium]